MSPLIRAAEYCASFGIALSPDLRALFVFAAVTFFGRR